MTRNASTASPAAMTDIVERLREENDIMRRHLNMHPDKPLGDELRAEVARLRALVKDLADDLEAELEARYPPEVRHHLMRQYLRDMHNVMQARALEAKP